MLRHTFATYNLATFRSSAELQLEMGLRSAELLRTRYVAMEGITAGVNLYWWGKSTGQHQTLRG